MKTLTYDQALYLLQSIKTRVALMPGNLVNKKELLEDLNVLKENIKYVRKYKRAVRDVENNNLLNNLKRAPINNNIYGGTTTII